MKNITNCILPHPGCDPVKVVISGWKIFKKKTALPDRATLSVFESLISENQLVFFDINPNGFLFFQNPRKEFSRKLIEDKFL